MLCVTWKMNGCTNFADDYSSFHSVQWAKQKGQFIRIAGWKLMDHFEKWYSSVLALPECFHSVCAVGSHKTLLVFVHPMCGCPGRGGQSDPRSDPIVVWWDVAPRLAWGEAAIKTRTMGNVFLFDLEMAVRRKTAENSRGVLR